MTHFFPLYTQLSDLQLLVSARCLLQAACCLTEFLHHCIVEQRSEILDLFVIPTGMNTIGEKNYRHLS